MQYNNGDLNSTSDQEVSLFIINEMEPQEEIQHLRKENAALKEENAALKAENASLKAEIQALKTKITELQELLQGLQEKIQMYFELYEIESGQVEILIFQELKSKAEDKKEGDEEDQGGMG